LVTKFCFDYQALAGASAPSNSVQGESIYITMFIARILPFMAHAIMDSDLKKQRELINVCRNLLKSMELLTDVEDEARDKVNADIDEEITKLDEAENNV
jgi:hypothetical protein